MMENGECVTFIDLVITRVVFKLSLFFVNKADRTNIHPQNRLIFPDHQISKRRELLDQLKCLHNANQVNESERTSFLFHLQYIFIKE